MYVYTIMSDIFDILLNNGKDFVFKWLKCYYDEKMFSFSVNSDFTFGKNAKCQLLQLNFKDKSDSFSYV